MKTKFFGIIVCILTLTYSFSTNSIVSNCNADAFFGKPCEATGEKATFSVDGAQPGEWVDYGKFNDAWEALGALNVPHSAIDDACKGDCPGNSTCQPSTFSAVEGPEISWSDNHLSVLVQEEGGENGVLVVDTCDCQ